MKNKIKNIRLISIFILLALSIKIINAQESYTILLTGNTSKGTINDKLLEKWQNSYNKSSNISLLMLGNIYNTSKNKFTKDLLKNSKHNLLLVPGEKEWANNSSSGKNTVKSIYNKLSKDYKGKAYMPDAACPGPKEIILSKHLVVILIDTYWWVHKYDRRYNKCDIETDKDVLILIEDAIRRHYDTKHIIIAGHNSLKSYGKSDGYFSFAQSLAMAPYVFYRKIIGARKDNHHPDFKGFRNQMLSILKKYPDIIYASAGDANLQYFSLNKVHHIVSGSIAESSFVKSKFTEFGSSENGFAKLNFSNNGECKLIFTGKKGKLFEKTIYKKTFANLSLKNNISQFPDSMTSKAGSRYNVSKWKYPIKGENYRKIWDTPIKAPIFNLNTAKDGLKVIKRGGGMQTLSLRLEDKKGRQYVLRSLEKNIEPVLPAEMRNTIAVDLVQGQISTSNPYAALVVANLAESAGVYHTNPKIVYVAKDSNFGIYKEEMANQLFIFEERPANNRSDVASFGYSENVVSTFKMIENIFNKKNHSIDADAYIRARIFDIIINDWDRHEDQWRWASFKNGKNTIYKPIPRDRDQAFFLNEGIIGWISARKWLSPRFQKFDEYTENVEGLAFNARLLDRTLLTQSEWSDWQKQIDSLKILLSPEKIDNAVLSFPKEIQHLCANRTAEILKARLNNIEPMAKELYKFLAKEVSITGTNEKDFFEIIVLNDTTLRINQTNSNIKIYSRDFYASETKRIHIYGFDKKDIFEIRGNNKCKIDVLIIGGDKENEIIYNGNKSPKYISIFNKEESELPKTLKKCEIKLYNEQELEYNRKAFKYDIAYPKLYTGYNMDDGIFLGGGAEITRFSRYKQQKYNILTNYAFLTKGFNFSFVKNNIYPLKGIEISLITDIKSSNYVNNYFGMGNETQWQLDKSEIDYYRVRMSEYFINPNFIKIIDKKKQHKIGVGIFYKSTDIELTQDRFISDFSQNGLVSTDILLQTFTGISVNYKLNTIPKYIKKENQFGGSKMFPTKGLQADIKFTQFIGLDANSSDFTKFSGEWISYHSFSNRPRIVYALRLGGEKLFGDYVFYEAAKLGQKDNLRGFRQTRFYGDASVYSNIEARIRIKQFRTYILNGTAGLLLFDDIGRVWVNNESSSTWHNGYGIGLWWSPFDMALLTISHARSKEDNLINVSLNYQF